MTEYVADMTVEEADRLTTKGLDRAAKEKAIAAQERSYREPYQPETSHERGARLNAKIKKAIRKSKLKQQNVELEEVFEDQREKI